MNPYKILSSILVLLLITLFSCSKDVIPNDSAEDYPKHVDLADIQVFGPLRQRAEKNFDRLEREQYLPDNIEYGGEWPGDLPGRLIYGQILLQQTINRKPKYLERIMSDISANLAERGYIGENYGKDISEQQLFGHLWLLRGLAEWYDFSGDQKAYQHINTILDSLMFKTIGRHNSYPINPADREEAGSYYGTKCKVLDNWIVSTDIGANFAVIDGLASVYNIVNRDELGNLLDEMIVRFLEIDLLKIKAQTHSSLSALRGMLKYYESTKNTELLNEVEKRFQLYKSTSMTENYENFNWFNKPSHTEPCAVIDSYILSMMLWRITGNTEYLEDAQLIYYNGICTEQRFNGGFGCNTCAHHENPFLQIRIDEAWWCCTLRGAEGLSRKVENLYFTHGDTIILPDYNNSEAILRFGGDSLVLRQNTQYPFDGKVTIEVMSSNLRSESAIKLFIPPWTSDYKIFINGKSIHCNMQNNYIHIRKRFIKGDNINIQFSLKFRHELISDSESIQDYSKYLYGPLLLRIKGDDEAALSGNEKLIPLGKANFKVENKSYILQPIYHLMDPSATKSKNYKVKILYKIKH